MIYYINGNTLNSVNLSNRHTANLYGGLNRVTSIAVNWLNSDVYLIENDTGTIEKITMSPIPVRTPLISGRSSPRYIVLDAEDGLVIFYEYKHQWYIKYTIIQSDVLD